MEEKQEGKKVRRIFTPEQKFEILKDIERCKTIKEGLAKHQLGQSVYHKWKRQLEVGVRASLRNSRPLKSSDLRRLEAENRKLKEVVLNQALVDQRVKKRDELGLRGSGRLMEKQKQAVLELVADASGPGARVGEVLSSVGVARSSYYRWKKGEGEKKAERQSSYEVTVEERELIDEVKGAISRSTAIGAFRGVAAAGSVSIGVGDLRAFKRAGADRAV